MKNVLHLNPRSVFIILAALVFLSFNMSVPGSAERRCCPMYDPPVGINKGIPDNQIAWQKLADKSMEEHIFLIGFFDQGIEIFSTIFAFKYGPFLKYGYYSFLYENSTKKQWFVQGECKDEQRKMSHSSLNVDCGNLSFSGKWPDWKFTLNDKIFQAKLNYHAVVPTFDAGKAYYTPDKKFFLQTRVFNPRGTVSGTVTRDGKTLKVSGHSYGDHSYQRLAPTRQGPFYLAVRVFPEAATPPDEQMYINFSYQALHKSYGGGFDKFSFLIRGKKIIGYSRKMKVERSKVFADPDTGYKYVKEVKVESRGKNFVARGIFKVDEVIEVMDIYQFLPSWARKLAEKFWKRPVYFRFLGRFKGVAEFDGKKVQVNQRATGEMNFTQ